MKLHLPKMLLTAVLAAVMMPTAWGAYTDSDLLKTESDWELKTSRNGMPTYADGSITTVASWNQSYAINDLECLLVATEEKALTFSATFTAVNDSFQSDSSYGVALIGSSQTFVFGSLEYGSGNQELNYAFTDTTTSDVYSAGSWSAPSNGNPEAKYTVVSPIDFTSGGTTCTYTAGEAFTLSGSVSLAEAGGYVLTMKLGETEILSTTVDKAIDVTRVTFFSDGTKVVLSGLTLDGTVQTTRDLIWNGSDSGNSWNTAADNTNWLNGSSDSAFAAFDNVTFDTLSGDVSSTVSLEGNVSAGTVKINDDYTFVTTGTAELLASSISIAENKTLEKAGAGVLSIGCDVTGNITVTAGELTIDGSAMGEVTISDGAKFTLTNQARVSGLKVTGDALYLNMATNNQASGDSCIILAEGSSVKSIYTTGVVAFNKNSSSLESNFRGADLHIANSGILVLRNGLSGNVDANIGDIYFDGELGTLQAYGSVSNAVIADDIYATAGTLRKTDGGTVTLSGKVSANILEIHGGTLAITNSQSSFGHVDASGGTLELTGSISFGESKGIYTDWQGFVRTSGLFAHGNSTVNFGNGTDESTITTRRIESGDGEGATTLNVKQHATVIVDGADVTGNQAYWRTGFLLGEYLGSSTLNVEGKLLVQNAHVAHGNSTGYINIKNGGFIAAKGVHGASNFDTPNEEGCIQLNLEDGGTLILGEGGIDVSNLSGSLAAGTIGITADATIADNLALSSATGTTFDTQKWVWGENGASISQGTDGGTLTISGAIADYSTTTGEGEEAVTTTSTGKLIKAGAGTLKLTATNTYSGGTDINGGTLEAGANNALGTGEVNIGSAGTLAIANGATFDNIIKGSGTYALGSSTTLQGTLDSTWTGTVVLDGASLSDADLNAYGNAESTVKLYGATGTLAGDKINTNVELANNTNDRPGFKVTTTTGKTVEFAGKVSGENFVVEPTVAATEDTTDTYKFTGDVREWTGNFISTTDVNLEYGGNATNIANGVAANQGKLNVTYGGTAATTVSGEVSQDMFGQWSNGTLNLKVLNEAGVTFTNKVVAATTNLAAGTTAAFNGTSDLGSLTLGAGASVTGSGNLTIGELVLNLQTYTTDYSKEYTLVSTSGTLDFTGSLDAYTNVDLGDYTANVTFANNSLTLNFTPEQVLSSITATVLDKEPLWDGKTLTLTVDDNLDGVGSVIIKGFEGDVLDKIFALDGMEANTMVGITLVGADGKELSAVPVDDISNIGFKGNDGIYYGQNVDGSTQYNVSYIPEPTTATLSLLALMGLAARRRRK